MNNITNDAPGIAVIMVIVKLAIKIGMPKKYAPTLALVVGSAIAFLTFKHEGLLETIYYSIFLTVSSVGLHSGSKNSIEGIFNNGKKVNNGNGNGGG